MAVAVAVVSKDASAIMVTTPVRQGGWHGLNGGKDASNRGNATGNNQLAQQKDERADTLCGRGLPREMCKGFLQFYILAMKKNL